MSNKGKWIHILSVFAAAVLTQLFFLLCLFLFCGKWGNALFYSVLVGGTLLNLALFAVETITFLYKKEVIYK